eukprot:CAMPEP_0117542394 /NCGR_PEP_ID=MMETSP0784-20121206/44522_1 /TAXON_ID=39447 /ORGANISM="" /LENGTH=758 /DNA_ID=CAMNT_0005339139 /DNA_START=66 /DNA_END=2343 /DNA_ORIENTATION=-
MVVFTGRQERKNVVSVAVSVGIAGANYMFVLFLALAFAVNHVTNASIRATAWSQAVYTATLATLRFCQCLFGRPMGALSDMLGRKPLMMTASCGHGMAAICFLIGTYTETLGVMIIGAALYGAASPFVSFCLPFLTDISEKSRLTINIATVDVRGVSLGLALGAFFAVAFTVIFPLEDAAQGTVPAYFVITFACSILLSVTNTVLIGLLVTESLSKPERVAMDGVRGALVRGNPLTMFNVAFRHGTYNALWWVTIFFLHTSFGGADAVLVNWIVLRMGLSSTVSLLILLLAAFLSESLCGIFWTKAWLFLFKSHARAMFACSVAGIITVVMGAEADAMYMIYASAGVASLSRPGAVYMRTVWVGQAEADRVGDWAGTFRSTEALGKLTGSLISGAYFAHFLSDEALTSRNFPLADALAEGYTGFPVWEGTYWHHTSSSGQPAAGDSWALGKPAKLHGSKVRNFRKSPAVGFKYTNTTPLGLAWSIVDGEPITPLAMAERCCSYGYVDPRDDDHDMKPDDPSTKCFPLTGFPFFPFPYKPMYGKCASDADCSQHEGTYCAQFPGGGRYCSPCWQARTTFMALSPMSVPFRDYEALVQADIDGLLQQSPELSSSLWDNSCEVHGDAISGDCSASCPAGKVESIGTPDQPGVARQMSQRLGLQDDGGLAGALADEASPAGHKWDAYKMCGHRSPLDEPRPMQKGELKTSKHLGLPVYVGCLPGLLFGLIFIAIAETFFKKSDRSRGPADPPSRPAGTPAVA